MRTGLGYVEQVVVDLTAEPVRSTDAYYVLESGRITGRGTGGESAIDEVRAAMVV